MRKIIENNYLLQIPGTKSGQSTGTASGTAAGPGQCHEEAQTANEVPAPAPASVRAASSVATALVLQFRGGLEEHSGVR